MKRLPRYVGIISVVVVLQLLLAMNVRANQPRPNPVVPSPIGEVTTGATVRKSSTAEQEEAIRQMWTRDQRLSAGPLTFAVDQGPLTSTVADGDPGVYGLPAFSAGGEAQIEAEALARSAYAEDWTFTEDATPPLLDAIGMATEETVFDGPVAETGTSQLYTRHPVNRYEPFWKEIPYKKIGRLFFSVPGGSGSCSASVISPYDIIVTAAHCLYDSTYNRWYDNWAFAPAYRDGSAPYGVFPFRDCWILTQWVNLSGTFQISSWTRYDVGVCEMGYNSIGQGLSNTVGWLGRSWNNLYTQLYHTFGYPSNIDSSRYLTLCISESFAQTTEVVGTGCDMTFGSSGGPLIRGFVPFTGGQSNFVNSVVSGGYGGVKNIYGPRFNSSNIVILCSAAGC